MNEYNLALRDVKVFAGGCWSSLDVGVRDGQIDRLVPAGGETMSAAQTLECSGSFASPGWVDLHTHLLPLRYGGIGTHAARVGLASGVTALLDVGTTGAENFPLLYENVIRRSQTPVVALLNIKKSGIRIWRRARRDADEVDLDAMARVVARHPEHIKGIKILASKEYMLKDDPLYYMQRAREAGDRLGLPVMVHIGQTPPSLEGLLPLMKSGDILTHSFRGGEHSILGPAGKIREDVLEAKARGVRFDIGHGVGSFSFPVAESALEQGFDDFTISSDLYLLSTPYRARNFANVLSKFLTIGMRLQEIMERCSARAAPLLGLEREIAEGKPATLTLFRLEDGLFRFRDCWGQLRRGTQRIVPVAALHAGRLFRA
jgi:dihydroorotase